jgi:hypothetical protein
MKNLKHALTLLVLMSSVCKLNAQDLRELTFYAYCNGTMFKSVNADQNIGYSFRDFDSTLVISGSIGSENCGIQHIFNARIDSNKVVLTETIIDTLLATCTCWKIIKIEIDSFFYDEFTVELNGELLLSIPSITQINDLRIFPNPTNEIIRIDLSNYYHSSEIELLDCSGRIIKTKKINGQSSIYFDLSDYKTGLYMINIRDSNMSKLVIKD